jgi:hypothetical protein
MRARYQGVGRKLENSSFVQGALPILVKQALQRRSKLEARKGWVEFLSSPPERARLKVAAVALLYLVARLLEAQAVGSESSELPHREVLQAGWILSEEALFWVVGVRYPFKLVRVAKAGASSSFKLVRALLVAQVEKLVLRAARLMEREASVATST